METLVNSNRRTNRLAKAIDLAWLGQTVASLCWIASVMAYGISSIGDGLQLAAASAWLIANIASLRANAE
ncbi:MAG: hypothetical protein GY904_22615 [Planctomycetaceae bacterium]|nr:hypothetical protein [Planctomycetaceae bacterium]